MDPISDPKPAATPADDATKKPDPAPTAPVATPTGRVIDVSAGDSTKASAK